MTIVRLDRGFASRFGSFVRHLILTIMQFQRSLFSCFGQYIASASPLRNFPTDAFGTVPLFDSPWSFLGMSTIPFYQPFYGMGDRGRRQRRKIQPWATKQVLDLRDQRWQLKQHKYTSTEAGLEYRKVIREVKKKMTAADDKLRSGVRTQRRE